MFWGQPGQIPNHEIGDEASLYAHPQSDPAYSTDRFHVRTSASAGSLHPRQAASSKFGSRRAPSAGSGAGSSARGRGGKQRLRRPKRARNAMSSAVRTNVARGLEAELGLLRPVAVVKEEARAALRNKAVPPGYILHEHTLLGSKPQSRATRTMNLTPHVVNETPTVHGPTISYGGQVSDNSALLAEEEGPQKAQDRRGSDAKFARRGSSGFVRKKNRRNRFSVDLSELQGAMAVPIWQLKKVSHAYWCACISSSSTFGFQLLAESCLQQNRV
jgi:hypothetical protein